MSQVINSRRVKIFSAAIFIIFLIIILQAWLSFVYTPVIHDISGFQYNLRSGTSIQKLTNDLANKNIIKHPAYFKLLARLRRDTSRLKAGVYIFPRGSTPSSMLDQMVSGRGIIYQTFTILAGWNFHQVRHALLREDKLQHVTQFLNDTEVMNRLGMPGMQPEGQFFPDTYFFVEGSSDLALLKRASKEMQDKLKQAWKDRASNLPYQNPYEAMIAASLVEKEASTARERYLISGVIVNRLKHDMLLQIDPTVIYGMGLRYSGKIYRQNLLENTPFNTYVHKGLPPTPIAMPSAESIQAVLHPATHDYFYFVATGEGMHTFSKTLDEHHRAVLVAKNGSTGFFNWGLVEKYFRERMDK